MLPPLLPGAQTVGFSVTWMADGERGVDVDEESAQALAYQVMASGWFMHIPDFYMWQGRRRASAERGYGDTWRQEHGNMTLYLVVGRISGDKTVDERSRGLVEVYRKSLAGATLVGEGDVQQKGPPSKHKLRIRMRVDLQGTDSAHDV